MSNADRAQRILDDLWEAKAHLSTTEQLLMGVGYAILACNDPDEVIEAPRPLTALDLVNRMTTTLHKMPRTQTREERLRAEALPGLDEGQALKREVGE